MIYIPDLFSAYAKGQEEAIDQNWQDLNQYETVEQARTNNDMARINLQAGMDDYGNNRAISNAVGTQAMIGEDLLKRGYRGDAANAEMNSDLATSQYAAVANNLQGLDNYNNSLIASNIGVGQNNADAALAYSNVTRNNLPGTLTAFSGGQVAQNLVAGQNAQYAPIINKGNLDNSVATQGLNAATIVTGGLQNTATQNLIQPSYEAQVAALEAGKQQIAQTEAQRVGAERQRVAATIDNLRGRVSANNAAITQMRAMVAQNPAVASAYSRQIIQLQQNIAQDQATLAALEKQFGGYAQNTVQSLMGN